ncbi:MAG: outer membrane beta-barrel protein [Bacteroidales bacterium]|jgi:hypothetical protein|nr:outer membrane beta-barrel protein [Bacteroidales bacterium]
MKPFVFLVIFAFLFCTNQALSQSKDSIKYFNQTSVGFYIGIGKYTTFPNGGDLTQKNDEFFYCFSTTNGIQIRNHQLGIGVGIDKWRGTLLFPVFLNYKLNFSRKFLSPYGLLHIGYSMGQINTLQYYDNKKGSFLLQGGLGLQIKLTNKISITTDLTYKLQSMSSSYKRIINPHEPSPEIKYNIYYNFIGISVGVKF